MLKLKQERFVGNDYLKCKYRICSSLIFKIVPPIIVYVKLSTIYNDSKSPFNTVIHKYIPTAIQDVSQIIKLVLVLAILIFFPLLPYNALI